MPTPILGRWQFSHTSFWSRWRTCHYDIIPLEDSRNYCLQVRHLYWKWVTVPEILVESELRKVLLLCSLFLVRGWRGSYKTKKEHGKNCMSQLQNIVTSIASELIFIQSIVSKNFHTPYVFGEVLYFYYLIQITAFEKILLQVLMDHSQLVKVCIIRMYIQGLGNF